MLAGINFQETPLAKRRLERSALAGAWITVFPDIINNTSLYDEKFQEDLRLCFGLELLRIGNRCNGFR